MEAVTNAQLQEMRQIYEQTQQPQESLAIVAERLRATFPKSLDGRSWQAVREKLDGISAIDIARALSSSSTEHARHKGVTNRIQLRALWRTWLLAELNHVKRALLDPSACDATIDLLRTLRNSHDLTLAAAIKQLQDPQLNLRYIEILLNDTEKDRFDGVCELIELQFINVTAAYTDLFLMLQSKAGTDATKLKRLDALLDFKNIDLITRYVTLLSRLEKENPQERFDWSKFVDWARQLASKDLYVLLRDAPLPTCFLEQLKDKKEMLRDYIILELEPRAEALEIAKQIKDFDKDTNPSTLGEFFGGIQRGYFKPNRTSGTWGSFTQFVKEDWCKVALFKYVVLSCDSGSEGVLTVTGIPLTFSKSGSE